MEKKEQLLVNKVITLNGLNPNVLIRILFVYRQSFGWRHDGARLPGFGESVLYEKSVIQTPSDPPMAAQVHGRRTRYIRPRGRRYGGADRYTTGHSVRERSRITSTSKSVGSANFCESLIDKSFI